MNQSPFNYIRWKHNDLNWSLVLNLLKEINGKDLSFYRSIVLSFHGLRRRMELIWKNQNWAPIYSDYGHMASSIQLWYDTLNDKYPDKKIFVIFQPHQINRIALWRNDFIKAMKHYDKTVIYDIYAARESLDLVKKIGDFSSLQELWDTFAKACNGEYINKFEDLTPIIESISNEYIIVIYSAWDIDYLIRSKYLHILMP